MSKDTNCQGCAVQQGTHKPAEALSSIAEPTQKPDALRKEYRATMPTEVLHLWAQDALTCISELEERLQLANQSSGAEAYEIACEELEHFQKKRAKQGKEVGPTFSLVEGMSWLYSTIEEVEVTHQRELTAYRTTVENLKAELVQEAARTAEEKLRADQMSQQHDTQAALNREAREQLAALKEKQELNLDCKSVQKRLATQWGFAPQAQDVQIESGAKRLSELFDYPWAEMPAAGRENMRKNVRDVLDAIAASAAKGGA